MCPDFQKKYIHLNPNHLTVLPIQKTIHHTFLLVKLCRKKKRRFVMNLNILAKKTLTCMGCSTTYIIIKISTFRFFGFFLAVRSIFYRCWIQSWHFFSIESLTNQSGLHVLLCTNGFSVIFSSIWYNLTKHIIIYIY